MKQVFIIGLLLVGLNRQVHCQTRINSSGKQFVCAYNHEFYDTKLNFRRAEDVVYAYNNLDSVYWVECYWSHVINQIGTLKGDTFVDPSSGKAYIVNSYKGQNYALILTSGQNQTLGFHFENIDSIIYASGWIIDQRLGYFEGTMPYLALDSGDRSFDFGYLASVNDWIDLANSPSGVVVKYTGNDTIVQLDDEIREAYIFAVHRNQMISPFLLKENFLLIDKEWLIPLELRYQFQIKPKNQVDAKLCYESWKVSKLFIGSKRKQKKILKSIIRNSPPEESADKWVNWQLTPN